MAKKDTDALKRLKRKLTIETLWIYVAGVLKKYNALHGYGVKKKIKEEFGFTPATITTYTVLYRLEREGIIKKDETNRYSLTAKGQEAYEEAKDILQSILNKLP